jgi:hypothetical protein
MKIHTRIVIGIDGKILEDEWEEYEGPVAFAGGSGGGSSGKVSYPAYVERVHEDWLDQSHTDHITSSVTEVMSAALGASPYGALIAYDPDADIAAYLAEIASYELLVDSTTGSLDAVDIIPDELTIADIAAEATAYGALIDDQLLMTVFPRFEAGMRDINAVVTSAFVIGRANLEEARDHEIAKVSADLLIKSKAAATERSDILLRWAMLRLENAHRMATLEIEAERIKIVAKKEENDVLNDLEAKNATWDLEVWQYGANVMASPAGGTGIPGGKGSQVGSAIGGALSGAAVGGMAGAAGMLGSAPILGMAAGPFGMLAGALLGIGTAFM